jgi:hypothetical protein
LIDVQSDALGSYAAELVKSALRSEPSEEIHKGLAAGVDTFGKGLVATVGALANWLAHRAHKATVEAAPPAPRACYHRDHHWLRQRVLEDLGPTAIRDRWNEAHPNDRVQTDTVETGIRQAKRDLGL